MSKYRELIDQVASKKLTDAADTFNTIMKGKVGDALSDSKINVASSIYGDSINNNESSAEDSE